MREKINIERAKKKEEEDKPLEFNKLKTKINNFDVKFNRKYYEMQKKRIKQKEDFQVFAEIIKQYENRECVFQPKINEDKDSKTNYKKLNSYDWVQRLYNDEIKNKQKVKEDLEQKYKPSFKPKINDNTNEMAHRWKQKNEKLKMNLNDSDIKEKENVKTKRINNSAVQRKIRKNIMDIEDKKINKNLKKKIYETENNDCNKNENNNYDNLFVTIKTDIINDNNEIIKKDEENKNNVETTENKEEKEEKEEKVKGNIEEKI